MAVNVLTAGVVGDGITDDTAAIQAIVNAVPPRETLYFPTGHYKLTNTIDCGSKGLTIKGDGKGRPLSFYGGGSAFVGSVNGPLWKVQYPASGVDFLDLGFSNTHASGTGLWVGGNSIVLDRLAISAYRGIWAPANTFTLGIRNIQAVWNGNTPGSVGIQTAGHCKTEAVDVVGYDHGIRACGIGVDIRSARVEVNKIGLALGIDSTGTNTGLIGSVVEAVSLEANDTALVLYSATACTFKGIITQGSVNAPAGQSAYGLQVNNGPFCEFSSCLFNGAYSGASVRVLNQFNSMKFSNVQAGNSLVGNPLYPAAKLWDTPAGTFVYEQTNRP